MSENNDVVRARINGKVKEEAAAVLAAMGLSVSDAFRMMMMRGGGLQPTKPCRLSLLFPMRKRLKR